MVDLISRTAEFSRNSRCLIDLKIKLRVSKFRQSAAMFYIVILALKMEVVPHFRRILLLQRLLGLLILKYCSLQSFPLWGKLNSTKNCSAEVQHEMMQPQIGHLIGISIPSADYYLMLAFSRGDHKQHMMELYNILPKEYWELVFRKDDTNLFEFYLVGKSSFCDVSSWVNASVCSLSCFD